MKPILFNSEMIKAILDDRKTVTRRIIKPQPPNGYDYSDITSNHIYAKFINASGIYFLLKKPYKPINLMPGDTENILYVRETWMSTSSFGLQNGYLYKANEKQNAVIFENTTETPKWRPSIHMPKEAARIFLRVKDVKVEKLTDLTIQDMIDEGINMEGIISNSEPIEYRVIDRFEELWNSTIKKADLEKYGFDANPWVWAIGFERISKEEALRADN